MTFYFLLEIIVTGFFQQQYCLLEVLDVIFLPIHAKESIGLKNIIRQDFRVVIQQIQVFRTCYMFKDAISGIYSDIEYILKVDLFEVFGHLAYSHSDTVCI